MIDLLYDDAALPVIKEAFPHVKVEDAKDEVHEDRVQIELPDEDKDSFYKHSIRKGYCQLLLNFELMRLGTKPEDLDTIKRWLSELDAEKSQKTGNVK